jgi:hypothetical protein
MAALLTCVLLVAALSALMVSRWRYRHQSDVALIRPASLIGVAVYGGALSGVILATRPFLFGLAAAYVLSGVLARVARLGTRPALSPAALPPSSASRRPRGSPGH